MSPLLHFARNVSFQNFVVSREKSMIVHTMTCDFLSFVYFSCKHVVFRENSKYNIFVRNYRMNLVFDSDAT